MSRRRFYRHRSRGMTKQERFQWSLVAVVFVIGFIVYFVYGFFANCIFEWPPRWDIGTCWNEQKELARQKAIEGAIKFAPYNRI